MCFVFQAESNGNEEEGEDVNNNSEAVGDEEEVEEEAHEEEGEEQQEEEEGEEEEDEVYEQDSLEIEEDNDDSICDEGACRRDSLTLGMRHRDLDTGELDSDSAIQLRYQRDNVTEIDCLQINKESPIKTEPKVIKSILKRPKPTVNCET